VGQPRLHLQPLDEELVRVMMAGLTGAPVPNEGVRADPPPASPPDPSHANERAERARRAATAPRPARPPLPVASLAISLAEATAMAAVAPLVGMTPRTVKRFVNIYRLLKTRAADAAGFDTPRDGFGDHEVVAFLLAVVTGYPSVVGCRACARRRRHLQPHRAAGGRRHHRRRPGLPGWRRAAQLARRPPAL
jgi:hypothetical protein